MINLFWSILHRFFHNAIAWPELNFIFKYYWICFFLSFLLFSLFVTFCLSFFRFSYPQPLCLRYWNIFRFAWSVSFSTRSRFASPLTMFQWMWLDLCIPPTGKSTFILKGGYPDINNINKFRLKTRKLWIFEVVINQTQMGNSVTYLARSPPICSVLKQSKMSFPPPPPSRKSSIIHAPKI